MPDAAAPPTPLRYHAFLSYSHQDNLPRRAGDPPGAPRRIAWADWLHHALETYRVPRAFIGRLNRLGEPIPARLVPCFQDEKELPTEARLQGAIEEALRASRYLIVLCSPRSARSIYVNAEVLYFKKLGRADRILPIIIGGEPNAALTGHKRGFTPGDECFCPALKHALRPDGTLDETTSEEPICADARSGEQKRELTAAEQRHERPALDHAKLKLIAGLLGVGYDDLAQRERQRQLRARRQRAAIVGTIMAIFLALASAAWWQRGVAVEQKKEADTQKSTAITQRNRAEDMSSKRQAMLVEAARSDRLIAEEQLRTGKGREAFAQLARACEYDPPSTLAAEKAVVALNTWDLPLVTILGGQQIQIEDAQFSPDGTHVVTTSKDKTARVWDAVTG